jgi:peptide-methionine (S)-S-oxide reductase
VGYSGGTKPDPTYNNLGDHTEAVQVDYDPSQVSYEQLLNVFWMTHDPCLPADTRQSMSAVFYHNDTQQRLATEGRDREAARRQTPVVTAVLPLSRFYLAEDYHQKFKLRQEPELLREFQSLYPNAQDLVASTAVARVNGYLGGHGTDAQLQQELPCLGLSRRSGNLLLELWKHRPKLDEMRGCAIAMPGRKQ